MRPRHKAAENPPTPSALHSMYSRASMRPRHKAAENRYTRIPLRGTPRSASMRPRHKAAENPIADITNCTPIVSLQ